MSTQNNKTNIIYSFSEQNERWMPPNIKTCSYFFGSELFGFLFTKMITHKNDRLGLEKRWNPSKWSFILLRNHCSTRITYKPQYSLKCFASCFPMFNNPLSIDSWVSGRNFETFYLSPVSGLENLEMLTNLETKRPAWNLVFWSIRNQSCFSDFLHKRHYHSGKYFCSRGQSETFRGYTKPYQPCLATKQISSNVGENVFQFY